MHNTLRARVRLGEEQRGIAGPQPAAKDVDYIPILVAIPYCFQRFLLDFQCKHNYYFFLNFH